MTSVSTNYKSLKIDNDEEKEYPLNLIGHVLNNSNEKPKLISRDLKFRYRSFSYYNNE
jgi:hypothetical protein